MSKIIDLKNSSYQSINQVINDASDDDCIILENKTYEESLLINKPITLIGSESTIIKLRTHMIDVENVAVIFEQVRFDIEVKHDAAISVVSGSVTFKECYIDSRSLSRDISSCIWVEQGSLLIQDCEVLSSGNFIKSINGNILEVSKSKLNFEEGYLALEAHGMNRVILAENHINLLVNFMSCTKVSDLIFRDNTVKQGNHLGQSNTLFLNFEGIEQGNTFEVINNQIESERDLVISVINCKILNRKISFKNNVFKHLKSTQARILFENLQGSLTVDQNILSDGQVMINSCSELILTLNDMSSLSINHVKLMMACENRFNRHVILNHIQLATLRKNAIINSKYDHEAVKLTSIDKLIFEQNKVSSVDHGLTLLNAGDVLEIIIQKNEFTSCRKRALNIASTMQKKYLKTEVSIINNLFLNNNKAIYVDDRNLKSCSIQNNYFSENVEALLSYGGKSTSNMKLIGNYFDASSQKVEMRSSELCKIENNELSDVRLSVRGCDDIVIQGNHFEKAFFKKGQTSYNEVAIRAGGSLTVSKNVILSGKQRHEKKEIMLYLNISAYERTPSITIFNNISEDRMNQEDENIMRYPDETLLSTIKYQIHSDHNLSSLNIDEQLKSEFLLVHNTLERMLHKVNHVGIKNTIEKVLKIFKIEVLSERETNDIYRFMQKSNETIEMLKLYLELDDDSKLSIENRIETVMHNYLMVLNQFLEYEKESNQDKLAAQLNLLENLL